MNLQRQLMVPIKGKEWSGCGNLETIFDVSLVMYCIMPICFSMHLIYANRYTPVDGPYKSKDIFAFVRLIISLEDARIAHILAQEDSDDEGEESKTEIDKKVAEKIALRRRGGGT